MEKKTIAIILIVIVGAILRFFRIDAIPPSLTWDEVSWGYNAYTLGIDGKDEFGRFLPVDYLESFGDFKPPLYAYLAILPVKLWGLSEFAVRFPSAFLGSLTVLITYFLVLELFVKPAVRNEKSDVSRQQSLASYLPLLTSFLLAISPWHINLSRAAFEANVATFFIVSGMWLFLYSVRKKSWLLLLSGVLFVLSLYTFNTARIVVPLLGALLLVMLFKKLWNMKTITVVSGVIAMVMSIPVVMFMMTPQAQLRYHEVNIFSDLSIVKEANQAMLTDYNILHDRGYCPECDPVSQGELPVWSRLLHNRRYRYAVEYIRHYVHHFWPSFLFTEGDGNPKFSTQDVGQMYLWSSPFLALGLLFLIREKRGYWWLIPLWLLIGILPAGTARETPHALRIETTLPTWQMIIAYGIVSVIVVVQQRVPQASLRKLLYAGASFALILNVSYYLHSYYVFYPTEYSEHWQYGYKEAVAYAQSEYENYDAIIFTTELGRPYIYTLFYTQFDPDKFRSTAHIEREVYGFVHVNQFDKYYFTNDTHNTARQFAHPLVIDVPNNVPDKVPVLKEFNLLRGEPALVSYSYSLLPPQ